MWAFCCQDPGLRLHQRWFCSTQMHQHSAPLQIWGWDIHVPRAVLCHFYPKCRVGDEFSGQELVYSDSHLWGCKEVGNSRAILKTEPKATWGGVKLLEATLMSHPSASSTAWPYVRICSCFTRQRYKEACITITLAFIAFSEKYFIHLGMYYTFLKRSSEFEKNNSFNVLDS